MAACANCGEDIVFANRRMDALYCSDICGNRFRNKTAYRNDPEKFQRNRKKHKSAMRENYMLARAKNRSKKHGIPFDIELSDITVPETCPVLGIPLQLNSGRSGYWVDSPSLDRIRPALGYTKGNVRVISYRANLLKSDATIDELRLVIADLEKIHGT